MNVGLRSRAALPTNNKKIVCRENKNHRLHACVENHDK